MPRSIEYTQNIRPILAAVRAVPVPSRPHAEAPRAVQPFITLSREPGAGAWTLAQHLAEALDAPATAPEQRWTCWDRELMEKVAADQHIHGPLIESLEESSHSWLTGFFGSLSLKDEVACADEAWLYAKVAGTIRALAQAGRTIIVGAGGVFITRRMPGGIHVRLVAPLDQRIEQLARHQGISMEQSADRIRQYEKNRSTFFRRYWPHEQLNPELFTLTLNTASIAGPTMVEMIRLLVRQVEAADPQQSQSAP
jgi:cytidylate kinase